VKSIDAGDEMARPDALQRIACAHLAELTSRAIDALAIGRMRL
jgi:hypothetical protein